MFGKHLWQGIGTAARIMLVTFAAMFAIVFLLTRLHIVLNADLATPLLVVLVVSVVILTETATHRRGT
ncbi:MAG: hypothetical protein H6671_17390 [Anaerolineaceae bacterium]|nr:hypothetical protein [Anaerolineaceae bacterium]